MRMGERATTRDVVLRLDDLSLPARRLTVPSRLRVSELLRELPLPVSSSSFYLTADGRPLPLTAPVASLPPSGSIQLRLRALRGGGGDGGAPGSRFTCCALSGEPLAAPAVADRLGNLFNKEALVEALLHKRLPKALSHIRGLKDMIPIHLHPKPDADAAGEEVRFQCPITGLEFNGKYQFLALRKCGHVLSVKALKEVKSSACLVCHKEFDEADKMPLNGTDEEVTALRQRMEEERGKVKEKKEKKVGNGLSGSKHATAAAAMAGADKLENGKKGEAPSAKRFKASDHAPAYANKEVYASIFTSSKKSDFKETYSCRSLPLGRN
uniref:Uncharacterized protein n=1 Tax=Oryza brachyantha TaxID=4533 RepID=J3MBV4_ORYBR